MNAQDYISSGLLEAYVLGSLDLSESEQVAGAMCRFPEVATEIAAIEALLIQGAVEEAMPPPADMQDKIWAAIQASGAGDAPAATVIDLPPASSATVERPAAKVIPFEGSNRTHTISWVRAAIWLALAGSVVTNYMLWSGRNTDQRQVATLQQQVNNMGQQQQTLTASLNQSRENIDRYKARLDRYRQEAEMMAQPGMQPVAMLSTQPGHPMAATIYWNKAKREAYVSVQKLPPPPAGMQYQLWAIADGKPVSIGMLENEVAINAGMQKVPQAVAAGQAFAVSLEKAGGNTTPTPDKIFLMGKMPAV